MSALGGVIEKLRAGDPLEPQAVDEIERVLALLQGEGWSGLITADHALQTLIDFGIGHRL